MLKNLIRLEILFNRRTLLANLLIFSASFAWIASRIPSPRAYIVLLALVLGLAVPVSSQGREDRFRITALIASLPVRRSSVVLAKYAFAWTTMAAGVVYAIVLAAVLPFSNVPVRELLSLRSLLLILAFLSLFFASLLPLTIRFGFKGIMILLIGAQFLVIFTQILIHLSGASRNPLRMFFLGIEGALRFVLRHDPTPGFLLLLAASVILLNVASFLSARALYSRRDL